jgi:Protein of unknown function (DUF2384)
MDLHNAGHSRGVEVREKISEMMASPWEHWVDQPLPILGNRTPMDAVKDPDAREVVESLVIQAERYGRVVAALAASGPRALPVATITATCLRTRSAAKAGKRS